MSEHRPNWIARGRFVTSGPRPIVMGIVNVTPDSFSGGGRPTAPEDAIALGLAQVAEGAAILDIGGESSRPGAEPVSLEEELRRVLPTVEGLASSGVALSIDTTKAEVARRALAAGACIVNDISAFEGDPEMADVIAESEAGAVLMHMQGTPQTMQIAPSYEDVVAEVHDYLAARLEWAESRGIPRSRIALDPGIGFGKTFEHNRELLRNLGRFASLGCTLLIGISRKGWLKTITGRSTSERTVGSVVSSLASAVNGATVLRVHDVGPMIDAIKVWDAIIGWGDGQGATAVGPDTKT